MSEAEAETMDGVSSELDDTLAGDPRPTSKLEQSGLRRGAMIGRYVVLERLGAGGMGVVVAAYDPELDRKVAIKLLRGGDGSRDDGRSARLQREARALARLLHPNVVSVFDVGAFGSSVFVAMEYVEGETLEDRMERRREAPWQTVVALFVQAGRGLAAAHEAGIVHRDFKPANAMVSREGRVVVLDFGLAYEAQQPVETSDAVPRGVCVEEALTQTGSILGTPAYMSPEQLSRKAVGPASDQFSFCVALYQALYGQRPFSGDSLPKLVANVLSGEIEAPPNIGRVPKRVHEALLRGLARDPAQRFPSMEALLGQLEEPPSKSKLWIVAAGVGLIGTSVTGYVLLRTHASPCEGVGDGAARLWNDDVATRVQSRFDAAEGAFGRDVFERSRPELDAYVERWAAGRVSACEATHVRHDATEVVLLSRVLCYERSLAALDGWVGLAVEADGVFVASATQSIARLPSLADCESEHVELRRAEVLEDPAARAEVQRIEAELERIAAGVPFGQYEGVEPKLRQAYEDAEAIDAKNLQSWARRFLALYLINTGAPPEQAIAAIDEAVLLAETAGDDRALIAALEAFVFIVGERLGRLEEGRAALARLEAVVERNGRRPEDVRSMLIERGKLARRAREFDEVIEAMTAAERLIEDAQLPFDAEDLSIYHALSNAYVRTRRYDEAEVAARKALELGHERLGEGHPTNALTEVTFARLEWARGKDEAALAAYRRAEAIMKERYPEGHHNLSALRNEIGRTLRSLDRPEEALAEYQAGLETMKAQLGPDHLDVAAFHTNIGHVLADLGRRADGIEHLREALRIDELVLGRASDSTFFAAMNLAASLLELGESSEAAALFGDANAWRLEHHGAEDPERAEALAGLGRAAYARGDLDEANAQLSRALELLGPEVEPFVRGQIQFAAAKVQWDRGEHDEARDLAKKAIADWETAPNAKQRGLDEVRAWLSNNAG